MSNTEPSSTTLHVRLPPLLRKALERVAEAEDRPVSYVVRSIIATYLKKYPKA
jgi:predicted transcriptional regulator